MEFVVAITAIVAAAAYSITAMVFSHQRKMAEIYRGNHVDGHVQRLEREIAELRARQNEHAIALDSVVSRDIEARISRVETGV